mmetsp:Transcript_4479/g.12625  ORF Transcript_4479/g.12625 Transcript_4479/m.12625 type:complete len:93 (+) Transcript_4479:1156-1434(+)
MRVAPHLMQVSEAQLQFDCMEGKEKSYVWEVIDFLTNMTRICGKCRWFPERDSCWWLTKDHCSRSLGLSKSATRACRRLGSLPRTVPALCPY